MFKPSLYNIVCQLSSLIIVPRYWTLIIKQDYVSFLNTLLFEKFLISGIISGLRKPAPSTARGPEPHHQLFWDRGVLPAALPRQDGRR